MIQGKYHTSPASKLRVLHVLTTISAYITTGHPWRMEESDERTRL